MTAASARDCLRRAAAFLQPHFFRVSHELLCILHFAIA